ncbi:MAG: DUF1345 domain-containing protein [Hymenobacter sp.]
MNATPDPQPISLLGRVGRLPTALRLLLAVGAGVATGLLIHHALLVRLVAGWDAFALVSLALLWISIYQADADRIRAVAAAEDLSRTVSFLFVLVAAGASLLAVVLLLGTLHQLGPEAQARRLGLLVVAVGSSWLLVHTVFTPPLRAPLLRRRTSSTRTRVALTFPAARKSRTTWISPTSPSSSA